MNHKFDNNTIKIKDKTQFNPKHILECGQIFRYKFENNEYIVYSGDKKAKIVEKNDGYIIYTDNPTYFINFFDLKADYNRIKTNLLQFNFLVEPIKFGSGIRILRQQLFETIISFIISANNNIPRIKNSIEQICVKFGAKKKDFYAFPTFEQLSKATTLDFVECGLGYRASQLFDTLKILKFFNLEKVQTMSPEAKYIFLKTLKGVGDKVASCVMLFAFGVSTSFPVDTWINKMYNDVYDTTETNREKISKHFTELFKEYSGFAQQYLFYYYKENK